MFDFIKNRGNLALLPRSFFFFFIRSIGRVEVNIVFTCYLCKFKLLYLTLYMSQKNYKKSPYCCYVIFTVKYKSAQAVALKLQKMGSDVLRRCALFWAVQYYRTSSGVTSFDFN